MSWASVLRPTIRFRLAMTLNPENEIVSTKCQNTITPTLLLLQPSAMPCVFYWHTHWDEVISRRCKYLDSERIEDELGDEGWLPARTVDVMDETVNQRLNGNDSRHYLGTTEHTAVERHHRYAGTDLCYTRHRVHSVRACTIVSVLHCLQYSDENVCWPRPVLPPGESRWLCGERLIEVRQKTEQRYRRSSKSSVQPRILSSCSDHYWSALLHYGASKVSK